MSNSSGQFKTHLHFHTIKTKAPPYILKIYLLLNLYYLLHSHLFECRFIYIQILNLRNAFIGLAYHPHKLELYRGNCATECVRCEDTTTTCIKRKIHRVIVLGVRVVSHSSTNDAHCHRKLIKRYKRIFKWKFMPHLNRFFRVYSFE